MSYPLIIQGGMGIAVSGWRLAREVSKAGQLGVVSGTALDVVLARRLQQGDLDGHLRRAMRHFPISGVADRVFDAYFVKGGKASGVPFKPIPMHSVQENRALTELTVLASFTEVFLAKEGHAGWVGINLLEKIQLPTLPCLFGAMLAGVDYVLMGAGIPKSIPAILDRFALGEAAELILDVFGRKPDEKFITRFDPGAFYGGSAPRLTRPKFLAIVSSDVLATTLARKASGYVDGFVVEGAVAGGHNAPPRGEIKLNERGEPIYGVRDKPDLAKIRALDRPFWLAGAFAEPSRLREALDLGAKGIQVGTAFAFCEESGMASNFKQILLEQSRRGEVDVFTDPLASPTGFPIKILRMEGTVSQSEIYHERPRVCDQGYLRQLYRREDGSVGYRCPGEPVAQYLGKGGSEKDTVGRKCVCNGLLGTIGLTQIRSDGREEPTMITAGNDATGVVRFLKPGRSSYSAKEVIDYLLSDPSKNSN